MKPITPSTVKGQVAAPPSKSMMGRALAAACLAEGRSIITNPSFCDDALAITGVIRTLGATVQADPDSLTIDGPPRRSSSPNPLVLSCGESALCMRMFAPIAALMGQPIILTASGSLQTRPMDMLEAIRTLGASCRTDQGHAPITVRGPLKGGYLGIDASVSSQFLTGLLLALPLCREDSRISAYRLKSVPYVHMTMGLMMRFGVTVGHDEGLEEFEIPGGQAYHPAHYTVEGDWSGASFILVAGAVSGPVKVTGLNTDSAQADKAILTVLEQVGARLNIEGDDVTVERKDLKPFEFDVTDCPDLFPPLVALAVNCDGKSTIYGIDRLRHKESNRLAALSSEFAKLGGTMVSTTSTVEIHGGGIRSGVVDSHGDHRIAMACAVAALSAEAEVGITGHTCVSKSYPQFFSDLEALRVNQ